MAQKIKISQVAICVPDQTFVTENLKKHFNLDFYQDELKMDGNFSASQNSVYFTGIQLALSFNHNIFSSEKIELEFITSRDTKHWHLEMMKNMEVPVPFLSHLGMYCSDKEYKDICFEMLHYQILQSTKSHSHSNKRADGSERHYEDIIFNTHRHFGFNLKLTRKI